MAVWQDTFPQLGAEIQAAKAAAIAAFMAAPAESAIGAAAAVPPVRSRQRVVDAGQPLTPGDCAKLLTVTWRALAQAILVHIGPKSSDDSVTFDVVLDEHGVPQLDIRAAAGAWAQVTVAPTTSPGLARGLRTFVWLNDGSGLPAAIWFKSGTADIAWTLLWPSSYNDGYVNVFEEDFTHAAGGSLVAGANIHNGRLWNFENSGAATACNWNPSGQGLTITTSPYVEASLHGPDRLAPIITMGLQDVIPHDAELDELWVWAMVTDYTDQWEGSAFAGTVLGIEAQPRVIGTRYNVRKRYDTPGTTPIPWILCAVTEGTAEIGTTFAGTNQESLGQQTDADVLVLRYRGPKQVDVYSGMSAAGAFPPRSTLAYVHTLQNVSTAAAMNTDFVNGRPSVFLACVESAGARHVIHTSIFHRLRVEYSRRGGGGGTSTVTTADEALYTVPIVDNGISTFYAHRNLLVTGGGTLDGIDPTGCIGGTRLTLTLAADTIFAAMGSPSVGVKIKTPRMGDTSPQDIRALADDVVIVQQSADGTFWKVIGGSFT